MSRVIVYARVSTAKQDLNRQLQLAQEYCTDNGHELIDSIVEKMSGAKSDRDGLKQLMNLTKEDCDIVVVSELSRISREEEFQRVFSRIDTLRDNGISVVFLDDPTNVYSSENPISFVQFIMLGVKAQGAREELLKIRDRMKTGRVAKLKTNPYMVTTSQIPFGFEKYANPDYILGVTPKSLIRVNIDEAAIIRRCFDMAITGASCPTIAEFLNRSGYIHRNNKGEKLWAASEVRRMLKNRLYIGERTIEGVTHQIEAIVDKDVFEQAGKCMTQNRCIISKNEDRFNPLKGLLFCGDCGLPMTMINQRGELVYKCLYDAYKVRPNKSLKICHNSRVYYDKLISVIWDATVERLESDEYYGASKQTAADYEKQIMLLELNMSKIHQKRKPLAEKMRKRGKQLKNLTDVDLLDIVQESYIEIRSQVNEANEELRAVQSEIGKLLIKQAELRQTMTIDQNMTIHEKAEFFNRVIEKITYAGEKFKRHGVVTIYYKNGDMLELKIDNK